MTAGAAEPTDAELIERALRGERDAFAAIYDRYQLKVFRFARSMSGSETFAEDITQEVFVALLQDLARYDPQRASLSTYLYGVARNMTRARLRPERRLVELDRVQVARLEAAGGDDPTEALARSQDLTRLRKAIVGLPSRYREVVILCDIHELSYVEAAAVIDTPIGTIRSRLHRARNLLLLLLRSPERSRARHEPSRMFRV
jgi:RNA polymerase sigma-70 factor, ECF subfamily